jgi:phosphoadenosine phosphosulfate reductase
LPNEWDYFDPAKADEKRECGLHASWGKSAVHGAAVAELGSRRS